MTLPVSDLVLLADPLSNPTHADQGRRRAERGDPHRPDVAADPGNTGAWPPPPPASTAQASPERTSSTATDKGMATGAGLRWATGVGPAVSGLAPGSTIPASVRTPP
ncbi:hypothetical protein ACIBSV_11815 [Embleya sp. NPDC050154]|uniref:hypothetical protein n=1 Tax=Embleya sp. NPDC050154 TaxID=3363988 RepID=UPI00379A8192